MQIEIRSKVKFLTNDLREGIKRQFTYALDRFESRIQRVVVMLTDINGTRGGIDKACKVNIEMAGASTLRLERVAASWGEAASAVAHRAADALFRQNDRRNERPRVRVFRDATEPTF